MGKKNSMEKQMKVCFVTLIQYRTIWSKLQPQNRYPTELPTLALLDREENTLFLVGEEKDFVVNVEDTHRATWLK